VCEDEMGLKRFIIRRFFLTLIVMLSVVIISFVIIKLAPGDPAVLLAGAGASEEYLQNVRRVYGLDNPVYQQFFIYLSSIMAGNLGFSTTYSRPVIDVILSRLGPTIILVGCSSIVSISVGILLAIYAVSRKGTLADELVSTLGSVLYAIPTFWLGLLAIFSLSVQVRVFPSSGMSSYFGSVNFLNYTADVAWHAFLPILVLSASFIGVYLSIAKAGLLEALSSNFVVYARAKGIPERIILTKYALRNSILPLISLIGTQASVMIGNLVIVENIFSWPGVGSLVVQAFLHRDYALTTGLLIFFTTTVALSNLFADILYAIFDPRVRKSLS
jgi:peptide/nickel transport system permease protein